MEIMAMQSYKDYLLINGRSFNTAVNYVNRIQQVLKFTKGNITTETMNEFLKDIHTKNKTSTINAYINAIRSYLVFLKRIDIILPKKLREVKTLPQHFDEKYLEDKIIPVFLATNSEDYLKVKAIFYFLFFTGIRIGEIDSLKRNDFNLDQKEVKILVSKTKEERLVFYTEKVKDILIEYFNSEQEETNAFNTTSMSIKQKFYRMKEYFEDINLHPHTFRHSFAIHCLKQGVDLLTVSKLLGHKNTQTTERY